MRPQAPCVRKSAEEVGSAGGKVDAEAEGGAMLGIILIAWMLSPCLLLIPCRRPIGLDIRRIVR